MGELERKVMTCPICGMQTFSTVGKCKCGYQFPYNPIQEQKVVDICSNCREIRQYKNSEHIGGTYTICPICNNGKLITLASVDEWSKMSNDDKKTFVQMIKKETINTNIPKCPTCQSSNVQKIGTGERVASVAMLGVFSKKINKSFKCKSCGYTW